MSGRGFVEDAKPALQLADLVPGQLVLISVPQPGAIGTHFRHGWVQRADERSAAIWVPEVDRGFHVVQRDLDFRIVQREEARCLACVQQGVIK